MLLSELLRDVTVLSTYADTEITDVTDNTAKLSEGCAFVCIEGRSFDGHSFAKKALEVGASVVIVQKKLGLKAEIVVDNTRRAYALMCKNLFGRAVDTLTVVGITGTNGKTTTAFVLKDLLRQLGLSSGLIGTVQNMIGDDVYHTELTTPDPYVMHSLFLKMREAGLRYCVMETSSQAFDQQRLAGIRFAIGVFTNLTQDHLDYHGTIDAYRRCKKELFLNCDAAVLNADDKTSVYMADGISAKCLTYGVRNNADLKAENVSYFSDHVEYMLGTEKVFFHIPGSFSVYNSLAAVGAAVSLGFHLPAVLGALPKAKSVPGRMELLATGTDYGVIIDYAHTPDGLEKAIGAVRSFTKGRVITVFGCGGDRDRTKRPKMGRMAAELSDIAVVTTDNPRTEDPEAIVLEVLAGAKGCKAEVVKRTDRTEAIRYALGIAQKGDTVLLAGKGHENYQIIGHERRHYDEREVVAEILNNR